MKTILIIASNSFTGSHLVNHCLDQGYKVIGISRSKEYSPVMLPYLVNSEAGNFSFFQLDINKDLDKILKLSDNERPEIIANFAAQGEVRNSWLYPDQWYETNTLAVVKLTEELRKRDYIKKYIAISTPEVYGNTAINIKENHCYFPSTPYAASKLAGDLHLFTLYKRYKFPVVFTRSANVYGIHQQLYRIIPRTIIYLKKRKKIQLHGGGKTERSFIHIKDVVNATLSIGEEGIIGDVYHISPKDDEISIYSIVKMICSMMDYDFETSVELIDQNFGQDSKFSISSDKLRSELNWKPKISLKKGVQEVIFWIEKNWNEISKMQLEYIHKK
jgi:dTDP-glucose 4,6-dehydratase